MVSRSGVLVAVFPRGRNDFIERVRDCFRRHHCKSGFAGYGISSYIDRYGYRRTLADYKAPNVTQRIRVAEISQLDRYIGVYPGLYGIFHIICGSTLSSRHANL